MEINYFKDFIALSDIGSFQTAADERFTSQPSLSRHIKLLEEGLGASVFNRTTRKVELNDYGRILLPYAKEITRLYDELTKRIIDHQRDARSIVNIGVIPSMARYNVTDLLEWSQICHPFLSIRLIEEGTSKLTKLLEEELCDFAFISKFRNDKDSLGNEYKHITFESDVLVALMSSRHPLASERPISLSQFKNERLILPKPETINSKLISAFSNNGFSPNTIFFSSRIVDAADMVRKGMGIAFVLKSYTESYSQEGITMYELDSDFILDVSMIYLASRRMSPACESFLDSVNKWINLNYSHK